MNEPKRISAREKAKQTAVFDAAADVFAQYGFRRTTMNDIAQAAGISRPALYLMFDNKENLFHELAAYRINLALKEARAVLAGSDPVTERFINALMVFEKVYTEPVANSPHGEELIDVNMSLAADVMSKGYSSLVTALAKVLKEAEETGEVSFENTPMTHKVFVELLLSSMKGIKKMAASKEEYRKQTQMVAQIFLAKVAN
ncbi:MAG: TetR/AcrR family transcriptional regulator [Pseudomonadales bacterium]|nr:TetR/AcrR family transcriptional regulator [Pseudomonadales bacterium]